MKVFNFYRVNLDSWNYCCVKSEGFGFKGRLISHFNWRVPQPDEYCTSTFSSKAPKIFFRINIKLS